MSAWPDQPGAARLAHLVARVADDQDPLDVDGALARVTVADVEAVIHPGAHAAVDPTLEMGAPLAVGLAASPGVARGVAVFDGWRALDAVDEGCSVILVTTETSPADEPALSVVAGVVTSRGGMGSHAAVIARGRGLPAVCGAHTLAIGADSCTTEVGDVVHEGQEISIDGSTGEIRRAQSGAADPAPADPTLVEGPVDWPDALVTVLGWADDRRGGALAVLANADTSADAARARSFGAQGIGLCRTEHQFLAPERLELLRRLLLAPAIETETAALDQLIEAQRQDFATLLRAMDGLPVTVRLLDPPLHEFLPDLVALERDDAAGRLDDAGPDLLAAARRWHEHDPMLGVRGVRLAVLKPQLYRMQVRALLGAAAEVAEQGGSPRPQILVPLVSSGAELELVRGWIDEEVASGSSGDGSGSWRAPPVGAMVETPRAALVAGSLARVADFLSFGTNDLTQLTFGLGRDDAGRILDAYRAQGLLTDDPFATLDDEGVGALVRWGVDAARAVRPDLPIGICGEHGGDPASIDRFLAAGLSSVSCSPFRVPVARLAAAQALTPRAAPDPRPGPPPTS